MKSWLFQHIVVSEGDIVECKCRMCVYKASWELSSRNLIQIRVRTNVDLDWPSPDRVFYSFGASESVDRGFLDAYNYLMGLF